MEISTQQIANKKSEVQKKALKAWADNDFKGLIQIATGVGKTRIGVIAACEFIKRNPNETSLIVVPTEFLRDNEWQDEIIKWGYTNKNVTIECIQTAHKRVFSQFDTLVIDEAHTVTGQEYINLLKNNRFKRIIGLSATLDDEKKAIFKKLNLEIIFNYSLKQAEYDNIISKYEAYNLSVNLTEDEESKYNYLCRQIHEIQTILNPDELYNIFEITNGILKDTLEVQGMSSKAAKKYAANYLKLIHERKQVLFQAEDKYETIRHLYNKYKTRKIIIFGEDISFVDNLAKVLPSSVTYHSKKKKHENDKALITFRNNEKNVLISARALNAGLNVPEADIGIAATGNSKDLDDTQRRGRILRPGEGKEAIYINLYCKNTIEERWVINRCKRKKIKWVSNINEII